MCHALGRRVIELFCWLVLLLLLLVLLDFHTYSFLFLFFGLESIFFKVQRHTARESVLQQL